MTHYGYNRSPEEIQKMYATVGQMDNCEGLYAAYITDPEALRAVIPAPLNMVAPAIEIYSLNVYNPNFATPYKEAALMTPVFYEGCVGLYPISFMLEGGANGMFTGRDQLGMPKKPADKINLYRSGDILHTDITRNGITFLDLDLEIGAYNNDMADQILGDHTNLDEPIEGNNYFFKYEVFQDEKAKIGVRDLKLLTYFGSLKYDYWDTAAVKSINYKDSFDDPWSSFPVVEFLGGAWTKVNIGLYGTLKETPLEASDEIIGKITANKYDAWQYGQPSRNL